MSIIRPQIDVKILHIKVVTRERSITGTGKVTIQGTAEGKMEEEDTIIFDFNYTGRGNEDKNKIIEYLKEQAWSRYLDKEKKLDDNTLDGLIDGFMNQ